MSRFLTELVTLDDGNGETVRLIGPLIYESDLLKGDVLVPAHFETDYASVPQILWNIIPKTGKHSRAAVIHDYLYAFNGVSRATADAVFKEALEVCAVPKWRCAAMYAGVRVGGWKPWNRYRAGEVQT